MTISGSKAPVSRPLYILQVGRFELTALVPHFLDECLDLTDGVPGKVLQTFKCTPADVNQIWDAPPVHLDMGTFYVQEDKSTFCS